MRLQGRNAIVTGAASGIGRAIAIGFAREGARVAAADINLAGAESTAESIRAAGGEAYAAEVDVARKDRVDAMVARAIGAFGRIHVLVAAPGTSTDRHFLDLPEDEWDRVLAVNLKSLFLCGQAVARHMAQHGGGSIINITSQCGDVAMANSAHYHASKGGGKMLTQAMALDLAAHGIRVNAIAPGLTETALTARHYLSEEGMAHRRAVLAHTPLARAAAPEEMVGAAVFLASDESSFVTGTTLYVDGGYLAV